MSEKILIVGGYGQVGRYVTLDLIKVFPGKLIVAGRSIEKAKAFSNQYNNSFETLKLDIYDANSFSFAFKNVKVAIMCLSPKNNVFAEYCVKSGVHYIDISPSIDTAKNIERFKEEAESNNSTCILGVGLAPGLSNLLVKKLSQDADELINVDISLLLGLGDSNGEDGLRWLLDSINHSFTIKIDNEYKIVKPFIQKRKTVFPEPLGKRTAYRFNLADQFIVTQTLKIKNASSYWCYDSKFVTTCVSLLKRIGIFSMLRFKTIYNFTLKLFIGILSSSRKLKTGTDIYSIQVDAVGVKNGKESQFHIGVTGNNNLLLTGQIAAFVAKELFTGNHPYGVFYLEELFSLEDLNSYGINLFAFGSLYKLRVLRSVK